MSHLSSPGPRFLRLSPSLASSPFQFCHIDAASPHGLDTRGSTRGSLSLAGAVHAPLTTLTSTPTGDKQHNSPPATSPPATASPGTTSDTTPGLPIRERVKPAARKTKHTEKL
ncbi:hypothetical protein E2C01_048454 [Portunus trituberculatus]|uniref:Uncharacterized protein n=1 Tax=Portunus trituberculatus TaxID=210409 RepID=A0A5B7GB64_PORTR|nr:hypothetical protein [Portunus trituberculatus]